MPDVFRYGGISALVAAALFLAGGAGVATASAPGGPRLAVVKWDVFEERYVLATVDHRGAQPLRLAGGGERERPLPQLFTAPTWSADGSTLAFVGIAYGIEAGSPGDWLYVVGADGGGLQRVPDTRGATSPVFAPDGSAIAFARFGPRWGSIWIAGFAGGAPRRITPVRKGLYMHPGSFSPDGATLLATRYAGRREEIVAIDLSSGKVETVLRGGGEPVYSPDGTRFALVRWQPMKYRNGKRSISSDVFTAKADGSGLRRLTDTPFRDEKYPSWNPSGERLAFVRNLPEQLPSDFVEVGIGASVVQVNADGTCPREIVSPSFTALYGAAWQPGPGRGAGRIPC